MSKSTSLPRRMALAFMEHAAWVIPSARGPWAEAMRNELPQIESDLEALTWAGGCLLASYVERSRTILMWKKIWLAALFTAAAIGGASWWAGRWWYHLTPGSDLVFRDASNAGAMAGFLVFVAAAIAGVLFGVNDGRFGAAARAGRVCAVIIVPYVAALALVSLSTPGTIVNIGDSYCYDLWCVGVKQVNATQSGQNILYTADVRIFVDSTHPHRLPAERAKGFFYVLDDQGRRYPLLQEASFVNVNAGVTVQPGESVELSFAFLAPPNARKLYLTGKEGGPPWVHLYFGSDISLFHRRALLRIL